MTANLALPSQRPRGVPLRVLVLFILLALGSWSAWNAFTDYQQVVEQEYRLLELRARHREANISGALRSVNLILGSIIDDLHDRPAMSLAEKSRLLKNDLRQLPELRNLLITDATGRVLASNNDKFIGFIASEREYFKAHRDAPGNDGFHLSLPFRTIEGITATTLSRVIRDRQGYFAGVIAATLEAAFFDDVLKLSEHETGLQSALINLNGDILNLIPASDLIGKNIQGGIAFTAHMASGKASTRHLNKVKLEKVMRMSVFINLPNAPLAVIVSRNYGSVIADWQQSMYSHVAGFLLLAATTLFFSWLAGRRQKSLILTQQQLGESEMELRTIIETEPGCVKQLAVDGTLLHMNRAGLDMIEADSPDQVLGQKVQQLVLPEYRADFIALLQRVFAGESGNLVFEIKGLKGGHRWLETHAVPLRNPQGQIIALLGLTRDITAQKHQETQEGRVKKQLESQLAEISELQMRLQQQVVRDPLTGLHNRRYLDETLPRELSRAKREGYSLALIMVDLDHFKRVNDTYGHAAGDEVLKTLASILGKGARESDIICRYGGEEFLVVLPGMPPDLALQRVETWRRELSETPVRHGELKINVTLSAGIAAYPDHGADVDTLLARADESMYRSKNAGRNRVTCFSATAEPQ